VQHEDRQNKTQRHVRKTKLVSWILTSLFSTNMAISETKGQGWRAISTQWRKASDILTWTLATFLFNSYPKKERDQEAHLNYYASAYNQGRQLSRRKTKLWQKRARILNWKCIQQKIKTHKKLKPWHPEYKVGWHHMIWSLSWQETKQMWNCKSSRHLANTSG